MGVLELAGGWEAVAESHNEDHPGEEAWDNEADLLRSCADELRREVASPALARELSAVALAATGDSNDRHIEALEAALGTALTLLGIDDPPQAWRVKCSDGEVRHDEMFTTAFDAREFGNWSDHGCDGGRHTYRNTALQED